MYTHKLLSCAYCYQHVYSSAGSLLEWNKSINSLSVGKEKIEEDWGIFGRFSTSNWEAEVQWYTKDFKSVKN